MLVLFFWYFARPFDKEEDFHPANAPDIRVMDPLVARDFLAHTDEQLTDKRDILSERLSDFYKDSGSYIESEFGIDIGSKSPSDVHDGSPSSLVSDSPIDSISDSLTDLPTLARATDLGSDSAFDSQTQSPDLANPTSS
jgi:hypothetical protein